MEFRIVVWNLKHLSTASEPSRLRRAEEAFRGLSEDKETAAFALVELGSDHILEHLASKLGPADTPYGTFLAEIWHSLIDGLLVSGEWLKAQKYALHDDRLEILTHDLWHHIGNQGAHHAHPKNTKKDHAITDHLPIAVNLEIL